MPAITQHETTTCGGVPYGAQALLLKRLRDEHQRDIIHIATHDRALDDMVHALAFFAPEVETLPFPAWDCLPYDRASPSSDITARRVETLAILAAGIASKPRIIVTTANAILQKLPPRSSMAKASFHAATGASLDRGQLLTFLTGHGYRRLGKAMEPGEFAVRGSIIDIFPSGETEGLRLDLFGDTLESIRRFDPLSQISGSKQEQLTLLPVSEVLLSPDSIEQFRDRYRNLFGAVTKDDPLYESISEGRTCPGMEHWLPLFYERLEMLGDYSPNAIITRAYALAEAETERFETILDYYDARQNTPARSMGSVYHALPPEQLYCMEERWKNILNERIVIEISPFAGGHDAGFKQGHDFASVRSNPQTDIFAALKDHLLHMNRRAVISCYSNGSRERIAGMLSQHGILTQPIERWEERHGMPDGIAALAVMALEHGFTTPDTVLISEQDIFGERIVRRTRKKKNSEAFFMEAQNFTPGELVVHREHGIGRFEGLVTLEVNNVRHDCLKIIYAGDDKLFLPVENIELLSRYGSEEEGADLDKLGSASWQARKAKLKERIKMAAEELLKTAAARALKTAENFTPPTGVYGEFVARFPYMETDDQARAIEEVEQDLSSGRAMDRLICGDVGFGKTEVALRAAMVAVGAGNKAQVAVVTPTTLLCRQHYATFKERFKGLPVEIRQLSRLVPAKDAKQTRELLADGKVDIVVGTHALLSKQVQFKRLGLLIVDEEQHFGVKQKEYLKSLKADVHVLTLSATPIPRTLQMALSGVRELSLITTPPVDRLAIRSFVMPFDPVVIREAILREHHRGGKTFCVVPRIKDMAELKATLQKLVPEIRIVQAHGQLPPSELDEIMNNFYDGKFDLLLSTAIIESGLDIPSANTIIIHRADRFGLSQLYQMRGRVGRGKTRAYAYFTLPHHVKLTKAATKRLEVMQTLDTLGAGFSLASHDMDIRGFGNLLGEEQSGHVREVGIELYQQMLEEAIAAARHRNDQTTMPLTESFSPEINMGMSVLIPESYVADMDLRLGLYRRISDLKTIEERESFAAELIDRFGPLPEEVTQLLQLLGIKQLCREAGVSKLDIGPKGAVLAFHQNNFAEPEKLFAYINKHPGWLKVRPDQRIVVMKEWKNSAEQVETVQDLLSQIAGLKN